MDEQNNWTDNVEQNIEDEQVRTPEQVAAEETVVDPTVAAGGERRDLPNEEGEAADARQSAEENAAEALAEVDEYFDLPPMAIEVESADAAPVRPTLAKPGIVTAIIGFALGLDSLVSAISGLLVLRTLRALQQYMADGSAASNAPEKLLEAQIKGLGSGVSALFTAIAAIVLGIITLRKYASFQGEKSPQPRIFSVVGIAAGAVSVVCGVVLLVLTVISLV